MSDRTLTVDSFSVSYTLDIFKNGEKHGNFVSITVRADPPVPIEDLALVKLDASYAVAKATILDALTRMAISEEDAKDRIKSIKENTESLRASIMKRRDAARAKPSAA